jgi:hypothetical protein
MSERKMKWREQRKLANPMEIDGYLVITDPVHAKDLKMRRILCPMNTLIRGGQSCRASQQEREKKQDGTRCYSTWVFRLIVSNATAGGTASMDMNMDPKATAEQGKKRTIDGQSSRAIMEFPQLLQISKELKSPRLRPTSVLAKQRKKKPQGSLIIMAPPL